jgi:hypothetical protein
MAPSVKAWIALSPAERAAVTDALAGEVTRAKAAERELARLRTPTRTLAVQLRCPPESALRRRIQELGLA